MNISEVRQLPAGLYIVPTPIGNLDDITIRAIKVLNSVNLIACEDTRETGKLLKHLSIIPNKLTSFHEHNESKKMDFLLNEISSNGKSIAIVSDAGMPGISDPGYKLINKARAENISIEALPGASALVTALVTSGMPTDKFSFYGFPPQKKGRNKFFESLKNENKPIILYESPYRIKKLVNQVLEYFGENTEICIARELTKKFEEVIKGNALDVLKTVEDHKSLKGEFVVIINLSK